MRGFLIVILLGVLVLILMHYNAAAGSGFLAMLVLLAIIKLLRYKPETPGEFFDKYYKTGKDNEDHPPL